MSLIPFPGHDGYEAWRCGAIRGALASRNQTLLPPPPAAEEEELELFRLFGRPTLLSIVRVVCAHYRIRRNDLLSERRQKDVLLPRQIAMYLAKEHTLRSMPQIGMVIGFRDHTTVLHAVRKIERLLEADIFVASVVLALEAKLAA